MRWPELFEETCDWCNLPNVSRLSYLLSLSKASIGGAKYGERTPLPRKWLGCIVLGVVDVKTWDPYIYIVKSTQRYRLLFANSILNKTLSVHNCLCFWMTEICGLHFEMYLLLDTTKMEQLEIMQQHQILYNYICCWIPSCLAISFTAEPFQSSDLLRSP